MNIILIEVKGGESVTSASFKNYIKNYNPEKAVRISKLGYDVNENFVNVPLYFAGKLDKMI